MQSAYEQVPKLIAEMKAALPVNSPIARRLESCFDHMSDELQTLKMVSGLDVMESEWRVKWKMTAAQANILIALARYPAGISRENLLAVIYAHKPVCDWPEPKVLDVHLCKIRTKLQQLNAPFWIETLWGAGFVLRHEPAPDWGRTKAGYRRTWVPKEGKSHGKADKQAA